MRYFGSKAITAATVEAKAREFLGAPPDGHSVCDPFGGIGVMASTFKKSNWRVTVADHLLFPHYYQKARLQKSSVPKFINLRKYLNLNSVNELEEHINNLLPTTGWITTEFGKKRKFFTVKNARKIDAVWKEILKWQHNHQITEREYVFLISSLVDSFDKVANTAGTYYAFLKNKTRRALHDFNFKFIEPVPGPYDVSCLNQEAINTVSNHHYDILYLDPPYSARSYDRYYHLPQTIASGEEAIATGISGVPSRKPIHSEFESPRSAERALMNLIDAARCNIIMMQYASGGLISLDRIRDILLSRGKVIEDQISTIGYSTTRGRSRASQHSLFVVCDA